MIKSFVDKKLTFRDIDPDALKVLYRLFRSRYKAYLVGGGVRDLLLGRRPKDFDVGTDAHPDDVRKLFRNCRLIGRRFRLAHVHFGREIIEVATASFSWQSSTIPPCICISTAASPRPRRAPGRRRSRRTRSVR